MEEISQWRVDQLCFQKINVENAYDNSKKTLYSNILINIIYLPKYVSECRY